MSTIDELEIPVTMDGETVADEFVRFWIADGNDYVSLRIGAFPDDQEAASWGMIAADIAKHAILGLCQADPSREPEAVAAEVEQAFRERLGETVGIAGQLRPTPPDA